MKYLIGLMMVIIPMQIIKAQLNFTIESIHLNNYNTVLDGNTRTEGDRDGPIVSIICSIVNNTKDTVFLSPSDSAINMHYNYNLKSYTIKTIFCVLWSKDKMLIHPQDSLTFDFFGYLVLGTDLHNAYKGNYIKEMICILPTLRVSYQDNNILMFTNRIKQVTLNETELPPVKLIKKPTQKEIDEIEKKLGGINNSP